MGHVDAPRLRMREKFALFSGSSSTNAIVGYAQQVSHPAYERLLKAEAPLRRLVPVLIVIFLVILGAARWIALQKQYVSALSDADRELHFIAELVHEKTRHAVTTRDSAPTRYQLQNLLSDIVPSRYLGNDRLVAITDSSGKIMATVPYFPDMNDKPIDQVIGDSVLLTTFGKTAQTQTLKTADGQEALGVHRVLDTPLGGITIVQPTRQLLAQWRQSLSINVTLFVGTSSILLIILYAYFAQGARAREADELYHEVQNRFDTALMRGKGGLWDWDLARGRIYWSESMYRLLGMKPREGVMGISEVIALTNATDMDLYQLANQVLEKQETTIDREFRMRHADGHWVWMRARAEMANNALGEPHLIGIAVDTTEQQNLKSEAQQKDMRLHDAIENLSEAFVLWDSSKKLVICNSKYQQLHGLGPEQVVPGMHYDDLMNIAKTPDISNQLVQGIDKEEGSRTIEARLEDGRWLQINERKTKDGGYVSVDRKSVV